MDESEIIKIKGHNKYLSKLFLWGVILVIVFYIVINFLVYVGHPFDVSGEQDRRAALGALGDYFGGLLNPIFAFLSFMGVLWTLKMSRAELAETRKVMDAQLKTQTFQQSDNLFSVMFKQILDCQVEVVKECKKRKQDSNGNLQRLRNDINNSMVFKKYFRLLFQTFTILDDILKDKNKDKLNQYIKIIRSQQEDMVLELLFVYISENREKPSEFHHYLKSSNFFKHIILDIKTLKFPEALRAYEEFDFVNKIEFFKKTNN